MRIKPTTHGRFRFQCPGCKYSHSVDNEVWKVDLETETITPSVLVFERKRLIDGSIPDINELIAPGNVTMTPRCHSFVTNGKIQYLHDSTHELAGQTVDLPEFDEDED